ncbi:MULTISPECIES: PDR/VanB family oxidoreductase [Oceanospirillaceae]|uniref:PDR/VanB family oxidoreductase n=1 Tax=Oceanobacter antarcticus TaxID=3133425 RepID=A0ABW8NFB3_9GAMM|tara:strand:+ start:6809 stop:7777 length:969 start_codon:yes stop_codon:yes gene_type:complete
MIAPTDLIEVRVASICRESSQVNSYQLVSADAVPLPAYEAGAHIDVHLPGGLIRQYSLCNATAEPNHYRIGVLRDAGSRGGSEALHRDVKVGSRLQISMPRNLFALEKKATHSLLLAGGIGITPMLAMAYQLYQQGRSFELHYCVRSLEQAAFIGELQQQPWAQQVHLHISQDGGRLQSASLLAQATETTHLYVCGPAGFMDSLWADALGQGWPTSRMHREYFDAPEVIASDDDQPFEIQLQSTGAIYSVAADQTVAQVLEQQGIDVALSCEKGICGSCLTPVLDGIPDHRDLYQTEEEQAANSHFTPCCSRSKSARLVLQL